MKSHMDVINAFGGVKSLAEAIGVDPKLAIHWPKRGIPAKHWPVVEARAAGRQIDITALRLRDLPAQAEARSAAEAA